jgi:hypothetical protein
MTRRPQDPDALAFAARIRLQLAHNRVDGSGPVDYRQLATAAGVKFSTLGPYLSGHRGAPSSWGARGGGLTAEAILRAAGGADAP